MMNIKKFVMNNNMNNLKMKILPAKKINKKKINKMLLIIMQNSL